MNSAIVKLKKLLKSPWIVFSSFRFLGLGDLKSVK